MKNPRKYHISFVLSLILLFSSCSRIFRQEPKISEPAISIEDILTRVDAGSLWSVQVKSLSNDTVIYSYYSDKRLIPASNIKLFTTAAAFEYLGSEFKVMTEFLTDGIIDSAGICWGNIYLRDCGNPLLSSNFLGDETDPFQEMTKQVSFLREFGIDHIEGDIILIDTLYNEQPIHPSWEVGDLNYHYAAEVSPFVINDNCLDIEIIGDTINETCHLSWYPPIEEITIVDYLMFSDSTRNLYWEWIDDDMLSLAGYVRRNEYKKLKIPVKSPERFYLQCLGSALQQNGIGYRNLRIAAGGNYFPPNDSLMTLLEIPSPDIGSIAKVVNTESHNLMAELLIRITGLSKTGKGSLSAGLSMIDSLKLSAGIDSVDVKIVDGSGLSRHNWVSALSIIDLLEYCYKGSYYSVFKSSLAEYGEGAFKRRALTDSYMPFYDNNRVKIHAKTGSMTGVRAFSGYLIIENELFAFSFICNNFTVSAKIIQNTIDETLKYIMLSYLRVHYL